MDEETVQYFQTFNKYLTERSDDIRYKVDAGRRKKVKFLPKLRDKIKEKVKDVEKSQEMLFIVEDVKPQC